MKLYNTLTRRVEELKPVKKGVVSMYNCGPTVYWNMQIGNLRAYTFVDTLRRTLEYLGYDVDQLMNLTDVGHLTDDADEGDDKIEEAAEREKKDVWEVAESYIVSVKKDFERMNFLLPKRWARATEHIDDMIDMVKKIEKNGYTYETNQALYFDVTKYPEYVDLQGGQSLEEKKVGVREELNIDPDKRHPADFALWIKCVGPHENHTMRWDSPWGVGFPGWHIECSAMGVKYLGTDIDIHTGGEDHIGVHHTNERAQNWGAYNKEVIKMWVHNLFLLVDGGKMGKSLGNWYELDDVVEKGFQPLDLRYFFLMAHYRTRQDFSWKNLESAKTARRNLVEKIEKTLSDIGSERKKGKVSKEWRERFVAALENDLKLPEAMSVVWDLLKDDATSDEDRLATILDFDHVLGLRLNEIETVDQDITDELREKIERLVKDRDNARKNKDWDAADRIRNELEKMGVEIEDASAGSSWTLRK